MVGLEVVARSELFYVEAKLTEDRVARNTATNFRLDQHKHFTGFPEKVGTGSATAVYLHSY
ncbi:hypothetical protein GCM10027454_09130 [Algoriphagus aestuariicola]